MKVNGVRRMLVPAVVLSACAVLVAVWYGQRITAVDPHAGSFLASAGSAPPASAAMLPSGSAVTGGDARHIVPAPIRITATREDMQQFILSFTASDRTSSGNVAAATLSVDRSALPQRIYMPAANEMEAQQRIADAAQRAMREKDPNVRAAALDELAAIGDVAVLPVIGEVLFDADMQVRRAAVEALQRIARHHGDQGGDIARWVGDVANDENADIAMLARTIANEIAEYNGEEPPFP